VHVQRRQESDEYYFHEGCFILELLNDPADEDLSIARARLPVGVTTRWHRLRDTAERYLVISGEGLVEVSDGTDERVGPGDIVTIAPMARQRIANVGAEDLVFYALCTPRFRPENYLDDE